MRNITKNTRQLLQFFIITTIALTFTNSFAAGKPRMAVAQFKNSADVSWWNDGVARGLASMLSNELSSSGKFRMVERKKLGFVIREQDLSASGRVNKRTRARMGRLTGAKYLVLATLSSFSESSNSGGGFSFKGISLGGNKKKAYVAIDLRVVNTTTGEISFSKTIEGKAKSGGFSIGLDRGLFSGNLDKQKKTPAGKAIRAGVIHIAEYLECVMVDKGSCIAEFNNKEKKRRKKTKSSLQLDGEENSNNNNEEEENLDDY